MNSSDQYKLEQEQEQNVSSDDLGPLSNAVARKLGSKKHPYKYLDRAQRGFGLQTSPGGTKTWFQQRVVEGKMYFTSLGEFPAVKYAEAKRLAEAERAEIPRRHHQYKVEMAAAPALTEAISSALNDGDEQVIDGTLGEVLGAYLLYSLNAGHRRFDTMLRNANRHLIPYLNYAADPRSLTRQGCKAIHKHIKTSLANDVRCRNSGIDAANTALATLKAAFSYVMDQEVAMVPKFTSRDMSKGDFILKIAQSEIKTCPRSFKKIEVAPCGTVKKHPGGSRARDRVLSLAEIQTLSRIEEGLDEHAKMPPWTARALLAMMSVGARVEEILGITKDELNLDAGIPIWTLPGWRNKKRMHDENPLPHVRPISPFLMKLIKRQLSENPNRKYVFGRYSHRAEKAQDISDKLRAYLKTVAPDADRYWPRDSRRSTKTWLAHLGVPRLIIDKLQDHSGPSTSADRHYDKYEYETQKFDAAFRMGALLEGTLKFLPENLPNSPFEIAYAGGDDTSVMPAITEANSLRRPTPEWVLTAIKKDGVKILPTDVMEVVRGLLTGE